MTPEFPSGKLLEHRVRWGLASRMRFIGLLLLVLAAVLSPLGAEPEKLPERQVRQIGKFSIEYSPGDEAHVDVLAARLPEFRLPPAARSEDAGVDLRKNEDRYLARVCQYLALKEATRGMESIFRMIAGFFTTELDLPAHYSLWRRPELLARLTAGENIPGFSLEGATGIKFSPDFPGHKGASEADVQRWQEKLREYWGTFRMPFVIGKQATVEADVEDGLKQATRMALLFRADGGDASFGPFATLHEVTEVGIVAEYLVSKDRRWFCDGVANYVAFKVLEAELGPERARQHYDLEAQLKRYAADADLIDLERWPTAGAMKQGSYREDLDTANYAFATQVIATVCAKHGDSILTQLFAEIRNTPRDKASMVTVYAAYEKLTGEDLRHYLPKPKESGNPANRR